MKQTKWYNQNINVNGEGSKASVYKTCFARYGIVFQNVSSRISQWEFEKARICKWILRHDGNSKRNDLTRWMGQKMICLDKIKEEEFDENEKEIIDIDSDSADELDELEDDELNNDLY
uniref:Uncharacterized protein n=1 Tax=Rhizophagus irregularis (strain DAOM 181602 / DAOM 197198 / MUCL 43194) TaxID=747089 RepID=U9UDW0_RHIID